MSDLEKINSIFNAKIDSVKNKDELQNIKTEFFGKNGKITQQFKNLSSLNPEERKNFASSLNKIKDDLTTQIEKKLIEIENAEINEKLKNEKVDINGILIPKKLLNKESNRTCPVCGTYSFDVRDDVYMNKYDCCRDCYIKHVEDREERWQSGWRPNNG